MATPEPVSVLQRWSDSGGTWRVIARGPATVTVALLTCTGEEVERVGLAAGPELLEYLAEAEDQN
ncbi:hypothetical protein [Actinoplanes aureus]|uniref:Uncharacterized protein n=1 Tax=Actinoplanes aureus TaxID=2792083 RepID=A0A931FYF3_9ACTN|nr:hypothetical protein [Actinoplanes aureus]MBG0564523.1 hypothetical protein [Actinoplanes aureus]